MRVFLIVVAGAVMLGAGSQAQAQPYYNSYYYPPTYVEPYAGGYYVQPRTYYSERYYYGDRRYDRGRHYGWRDHRNMVRVCRWRHHQRVCWWTPRRRW